MKKPEVISVNPGSRVDEQITINERERLTDEGRFLLDLLRSAVYACRPDSVSSTGEQLYRQCTPQEVVSRAVEITQLTFAAVDANEWKVEIPPFPGEVVKRFP